MSYKVMIQNNLLITQRFGYKTITFKIKSTVFIDNIYDS